MSPDDNAPDLETLMGLDDSAAPLPPAEAEKPKRAVKAKAPSHNHPILSDEEVEAAREAARKAVEKERKDAAMDAFIKEEKARLQREEGLVTGDGAKDEMVRIALDLAEHSGKIVINGFEYHHGFTYTVPRHVADTLREIQSRGHGHQNEIEGKSMAEAFRRPHNTGLSPIGAKNAPAPVAV